jgi:heme-degrading monooxygenase HmoA
MKQHYEKTFFGLLLVCGVFLFLFASPLSLQSQNVSKDTIARVWEGRTSPARADEYEKYLMDAGVPRITSASGNLGVQILRRPTTQAVEFVVISYWESREAIKKLVGQDIEKAFSLPRDSEFLLEPMTTVRHYQIAYSK